MESVHLRLDCLFKVRSHVTFAFPLMSVLTLCQCYVADVNNEQG